MLKEQLLAEAQNIDSASVQLDSIFESVELSDEVKANFTAVFEQAVKNGAVKLAESHISQIAEKSDLLVAEQVQARTTEIETKLYEDVDTYFSAIADEWLKENKVAVSRDIKVDLFESLFTGIKELVVTHNVILPESQVDVVAELEDELTENQAENKRLFETNANLNKEISDMKRTACINEKTKDLTETQKEKVSELIEGLSYSDKFDSKLSAIVEMVSATKKEKETVNENNQTKDDNFQPSKDNIVNENSNMSKYVQAAKRLS